MLIRDGDQTNHIGEDRWVKRMDQTKRSKVRENPRIVCIYIRQNREKNKKNNKNKALTMAGQHKREMGEKENEGRKKKRDIYAC